MDGAFFFTIRYNEKIQKEGFWNMNNILDYLVTGKNLRKAYGKYMDGIGEQYGLTRMEIDVLLFLYNNPGHDTASDLVELRSIAKSYVSMAVESLTRKHYLEQFPDGSDRRIIHLKIRKEAMDAVHAAKERQDTFLQNIFSGVSEADQQAMDRIFSTLSRNLRQLSDTKEGGEKQN